jgi:hypothetical protein
MSMALRHRNGRLPIEKIRRFLRENPGTGGRPRSRSSSAGLHSPTWRARPSCGT